MLEEYRRFAMEGWAQGMRYAMQTPRGSLIGVAGGLLGKAAGSSIEFMDYREYQPGDDLRTIDWSAFGRTDKLMVRMYRQEVCPHLDLVIDCSASMALESTAKARATMALAGMLASGALNAGYTCSLHRLAETLSPAVGGGGSPLQWDGLDLDYAGDSGESFMRMAASFRPRGMRILISDLLWRTNPLSVLGRLAHQSLAAVVVTVQAREDIDGPEDGEWQLADSETGEILLMVVDSASRVAYRQAAAAHRQGWHDCCRANGAVMVEFEAEAFCRDWNARPLLETEVLRFC